MISFLENHEKRELCERKTKKIADSLDFYEKYKTEICRYWLERGRCEYGDSCAFAHGFNEIRRKCNIPANYKTKKCKNYHENGYCLYGFRCQFLHNIPNSRRKSSAFYVQTLENLIENEKVQENRRLPAFEFKFEGNVAEISRNFNSDATPFFLL